jgi:hypothetical protein
VPLECFNVALLVVERLDDLDLTQRLARITAHPRQRVLTAARQVTHATPDHQHEGDDDRRPNHDDHRELRIADHQQDQSTDEHERIAQRNGHGRSEHGLQQRGVGRDPGQHLPDQVRFRLHPVVLVFLLVHRPTNRLYIRVPREGSPCSCSPRTSLCGSPVRGLPIRNPPPACSPWASATMISFNCSARMPPLEGP